MKQSTKVARFRLDPELLKQIEESADASDYSSLSDWVRDACREKLRREQRGRTIEQRIFANLRTLDAGMRLSFVLNAGLARLLMLYFPEPMGETLEANEDTLDQRYQQFMMDVASLFHDEPGDLFGKLTAAQNPAA